MNVDEAGFYLKSMKIGREKSFLKDFNRDNTTEPKRKRSIDHFTMIYVVFVPGKLFNQLKVP